MDPPKKFILNPGTRKYFTKSLSTAVQPSPTRLELVAVALRLIFSFYVLIEISLWQNRGCLPFETEAYISVLSLLIASILEAVTVGVPACSVQVLNHTGERQLRPEEALELLFID